MPTENLILRDEAARVLPERAMFGFLNRFLLVIHVAAVSGETAGRNHGPASTSGGPELQVAANALAKPRPVDLALAPLFLSLLGAMTGVKPES